MRTLLRQRRFRGPLGARRGFRRCSLILNFMPLVLPTLLLCNVLHLTLQPVFLFATKWSCLSDVSTSWKILLHPLVEYFRMYLREISCFSGSTKRCKAPSNVQFRVGAIFQVISHRAPSNSLLFPGPLATILYLKKQTNFVAKVRSTSFGACPIAND